MGVTVNTSDDLLNALAAEQKIELARGEYVLDPTKLPAQYMYFDLSGVRVPYAEIHLTSTLHVAHESSAIGITFVPLGNFAALNWDRAAYASFQHCTFKTRLDLGSHLESKVWSDFPHEGIGVETTLANDGDNSYWITLDRCKFIGLTAGLKAGQAGMKALNELLVNRCEFDRCEVAFGGEDVGNTTMRECHIQLARVGLDVKGQNNRFEWIRLERTATPIALRAESFYNNFHIDGEVSVLDETGEFRLKGKTGKKVSRGKLFGNVFVMETTRHIART